MAQEDFTLSVGLLADTDQLESQIEDGDFTAEVDMSGTGGGGGGGGVGLGGRSGRSGLLAGGAGLAVGGVIVGLLAGILAQLEPITTLVGFIARQFELFLVPVIATLSPILNQLNEVIAKTLSFLRDPLNVENNLFEPAGRLSGERRERANAVSGLFTQLASTATLPGAVAGYLLESSDEAQKEKQGSILSGLLQNDFW